MAVALPTALAYSFAATSNSSSRTIDASSNLLIVGLSSRFTPTTFAATWNGVSLTDVGGGLQVIGSAIYQQLFYMTTPPTGAQTLAITLGQSRVCVVSVYGISGADTTTPFRSQAGANYLRSAVNTGTSLSVALAGSAGDLALDVVSLEAATDTTLTATGTGQTEAFTQIRDNTGTDFERVGGSSEAGAATSTLSWTLGAARVAQQLGVMVAAAAVAAAPPRRMLMGVGA